MFADLKANILIALAFARLAIQRQLEYPSFLVSWFLMIPIQYFAGIWMLKVIVDRFQPLNGWSFSELTFVYGLGLLSHGIMVVLFIQTWGMSRMVIKGEFDRMILRPVGVFFQFIVMYINFIGLIDLIPGTIIFLYGCKLVGFALTPMNILKVLIIVFGGVLIRGAIFIITGSIAFWTKASSSLVQLNLNLLRRTTMYPLSIYPYIVQLILTFIIPVGFICFYPASGLLDKNHGMGLPFELVISAPVVGIIMFTIAKKIFKSGLKIYESAGS